MMNELAEDDEGFVIIVIEHERIVLVEHSGAFGEAAYQHCSENRRSHHKKILMHTNEARVSSLAGSDDQVTARILDNVDHGVPDLSFLCSRCVDFHGKEGVVVLRI